MESWVIFLAAAVTVVFALPTPIPVYFSTDLTGSVGNTTEEVPPPPNAAYREGDVDCSLSAETGPCKAAFEMYYYNSTIRECQKFTYGGCEGNSNRFETKEECHEQCPSPSQNII